MLFRSEFKEYQRAQTAKQISSLQLEIKALKEKKIEAISTGEGSLAVSIEDQIDILKEEQQRIKNEVKVAENKPKVEEALAPELQEWISNNSWYTQDVRMQAAANVIAEDISRGQPWLKGKEFLVALDKALEDNFTPERLGRSAKKKERSPVEGVHQGGGSTRNDKHSYENLPAEAKAACDMFVKNKLMTREQYCSEYYA